MCILQIQDMFNKGVGIVMTIRSVNCLLILLILKSNEKLSERTSILHVPYS